MNRIVSLNHIAALAVVVFMQSSGIAFAGGRTSDAPNLADRFQAQQAATSQIMSIPATANAALACTINIPPQSNALVVTRADHSVEMDAQFDLRRTLQAISDSASVTTSPDDLFGSMRSTYENPDGTDRLLISNQGVDMPVDPRPSERDFVISDISFARSGNAVNEMLPSGIFNRFDLAASDGSNCGEYRIVYHWEEGLTFGSGTIIQGSQRFLMIFEAVYPNPAPENGIAGCLPLANYWESLNAIADSTTLISKLADFYYDGVMQDGVFLPPVINFRHYMQGAGQVRVNTFVNDLSDGPPVGGLDDPNIWQLREFRTAIDQNGDVIFDPDTNKVNPLFELYSDLGNLPASLSHITPEFHAAFQDDFVAHVVEGLVTPELENLGSTTPLTQTEIINQIRMVDLPDYNEFQSNSGGGGPGQDGVAGGPVFASAVDQKLADLGLGSALTSAHVFNRAEAMSCAGCHFVAIGSELSPGIVWPGNFPTSFMHMREDGQISGLLASHFLPARADILTDFICNPPACSDVDADQVCDLVDNCIEVANADQTDTDGDGHGNICDADFDQSCFVNFFDLAELRLNFGGSDPEFDLNSSGPPVNFADLFIFRQLFASTPGPSAAGALCNP